MKHVLLQELHERYKNGFIIAATILLSVAFLISLGLMHGEYQQRQENHAFSQSFDEGELFWNRIWYYEFGENNSTSSDSATLPMPLVMAPDPLMVVTRGLDTRMRQGVDFVKNFPIFSISFLPEQDKNLRKKMFPAPDFLTIVNILVTLLSILGSYALVSGLRERGLLKLMLSSGASRKSIFIGGYLGGLISMVAAFTAAFLLYVIALEMTLPVELLGADGLRLFLLYLAVVLTIAVFHGIGTLISARTQSSSAGLVISLFAWLMIVFIIPGGATLMAQQLQPVESTEKIERMKLEKAIAMEEAYTEEIGEQANSSTGGYGQRHDEIRPQINAELEKIEQEHQRHKDRQMQLTATLARLSPTGSLTHIASTMCRTGKVDYELYMEDLRGTRKTVDDNFTAVVTNPDNQDLFAVVGFDASDQAQEIIQELFATIQNTPFRNVSTSQAAYVVLPDFLILAAASMLLFAAGFYSILRYDVR